MKEKGKCTRHFPVSLVKKKNVPQTRLYANPPYPTCGETIPLTESNGAIVPLCQGSHTVGWERKNEVYLHKN